MTRARYRLIVAASVTGTVLTALWCTHGVAVAWTVAQHVPGASWRGLLVGGALTDALVGLAALTSALAAWAGTAADAGRRARSRR